jgi:DNA-directed RNA polymerase specialized sigma24 family protein
MTQEDRHHRSNKLAGAGRRSRDEVDWELLTRITLDRLNRHFRSKGWNVARDVIDDGLQSALTLVYSNFNNFDESKGDLPGWVFAIARNQIKNICKRSKYRKESEYKDIHEADCPDEEPIDSILKSLIEIIDSLPNTKRYFLLDYAQGLIQKSGAARIQFYRLKRTLIEALRMSGHNIPATVHKKGFKNAP